MSFCSTLPKTSVAPVLLLAMTMGLPVGCRAADAIPGPPDPHYQSVFRQDFTTLSTLSVAPHDIGSGTWIAHTPSYQDWFTFQDPGPDDGHPFSLGNGYLTIRVQKDGNDPHNWFAGYSGGLLSSMDGHGKGFAQQYGYFEASMQTPGTPNTWPGFWLLDAPTLTDKTLPDGAEIDITESYGNFGTGPGQKPPGDPNQDGLAWHDWGHNGTATTSNGAFVREPGMTTGFHTYGVDVEPDTITWYFDRKQVWQIATYAAARRPLFVLLNLALGGGTHNNAAGSDYDWSLTPIPTDLKVKYVAVWASPNSPNYKGRPAAPTKVSAVAGSARVSLTWAAGGVGSNIYRGTRPGGEGRTPIATGVKDAAYLDTGLKNGTTYYYQVAAVNAGGESARSAEAAATPGPAHTAAVYVKTDDKTQGSWPGVYGADGYSLSGDGEKYPAYAKVTFSATNLFTWTPTADVRALQKAGKPAERIASEMHADRTVTLDIDLTDGKMHRVALYFLDWDHKGEINGVQVKDAVFGDVLDTRSFASFGGGQYGVWDLRGHVQIVIGNAAPTATNSQATVSGLFFGGGVDTP